MLEHTYQIEGMTCNGCRNSVEESLNQVEGVHRATVDLEKAEAVIKMASHIPIQTLQNV